MTISVGAGESFTIPLTNGFTYNFTVDWGDGSAPSTVTTYNDADRVHSYTNAGTYDVKILGLMQQIRFNNGGDKLKLIAIKNWGKVGITNMDASFYGCTNLASIPNSPIPFISITTCYSIFRNCTSITSIPDNLFYGLASCTNYDSAFYGCTGLTTISAKLFEGNTIVTNFTSCFQSCSNLSLVNGDIFKGCSSASLFSSCFRGTALTSIPSGLFSDCVAATYFDNCFYSCTSINGNIPTDLFRYCTEVRNFSGCFYSCSSLDGLPENLFYYNSKVTDYSLCFLNCRNLTIPSVIFNLSNISIVTTFNRFMEVANTTYSFSGTIQDIWNYNSGISTSAFLRQTGLSNYSSIPAGWK